MPTKRRPNTATPSKLFTKRRSLPGLGLIASIAMVAASGNLCAETEATTKFVHPLLPPYHGNPAALGWTILLVGFVTASLVQWAKDLLGWRANFHRKTVGDWVRRRADSPAVSKFASEISPESDPEVNPAPGDALAELEKLIGGTTEPAELTGADDRVQKRLPAYSLPAEQLCGQLASAAEVTIATPSRYSQLFAVLIASGDPPPLKDVKEYVDKIKDRALSETLSNDQRYADLRAQFMLRAQRSLDNLQILIGQRWRRRLTLGCLYCSFYFGLAAVYYFLGADLAFQALPWYEKLGAFLMPVLIVTIAGALIAPLAHDLALAIRSFRRS